MVAIHLIGPEPTFTQTQTDLSKTACGYPNYCARTDRRIEPYPQTPPSVGPVGSIVLDPNFGSRILRVTDANTDSRRPGQSFHTPSSSQQNSWNSTTTKFYVVETGGQLVLYDFDPSKMTGKVADILRLHWRGEPQFSYSRPNLMYGVSNESPEFQQYDLSTGKLSTIHKVSDCLKVSGADHAFDISVSADDRLFMGVIGPGQDTNYLVYLYDREKGCRWLDTQKGEIGGQWGMKGTLPPSSLRFGVHDARISKSGEFAAITGSHQGPVIWQVGTLKMVLCSGQPPDSCGGHHALGYSHMINPSRRHHPMELLVRPLTNLSHTASVVPDLQPPQGWYDKHISWNNVDPSDSNPACLSNYRTDNPDTPGAPLTVRGPWENEIDCFEMDGKGSRVWRFAHTYSTARNGFWTTPRGNVSQDGRFYMFTSDWQDELGLARDGKHRHDVFVVELK